jgi:uncharacterized protein
MRLKPKLYTAAGFLCVALGVIGIPTPILPTTPFLLLAAFCFARGNDRWRLWLLTHPTLSPYILAFQKKQGLTRAQKRRIVVIVTLSLAVTAIFAPFYGKILALVIWSTSLLFLYFAPDASSD